MEDALAAPKQKVIRHRPELTDEQITEELANRSLRARRLEECEL